VEAAAVSDLASLIKAVSREDLEESAIETITSAAYVVRDDGEPVAACGFQRWPRRGRPLIAHMCVLTHPRYRGAGLGRRVAEAALVQATTDGLIAQWRALPIASQALARSLGLIQLGAQLSVRLES
jgi:GNAT superfamily N-acetyltransferase